MVEPSWQHLESARVPTVWYTDAFGMAVQEVFLLVSGYSRQVVVAVVLVVLMLAAFVVALVGFGATLEVAYP